MKATFRTMLGKIRCSLNYIANEQLVQSFKNYKFTGHNPRHEPFDTYDKLMGCATSALRKRYSNSNSSYYSRSRWTPELNRCKDNLSFHFREWKEIGFRKATDCIEYNRYIIARKNFRKAVKSAQNKKLYKKYINI